MSSPTNASAERRANLIREMARTSSRASVGSSASSVRNDQPYATETQEIPLPYEPNYQINSSALRRAFPDFSQYGSSEEDSIEVGRGIKSKRTATNGNALSLDVSEDMSLNLGAGGLYRVTGTPPVKARDSRNTSGTNARLGSNSYAANGRRSGLEGREETLEKISEYVAVGSHKGSAAELQARVESDESLALDNRNGSIRQASMRKSDKAQNNANGTITSNISGGNDTYQSFMLPDLPNITELVSGVRQDGTPLFPRSAKARSRFGTPSARRISATKPSHIPIANVPIPAEEKALHISLQLLQEKVATLEKEKAQSEARMEECELELLQLKSRLEDQGDDRQKLDISTWGASGANPNEWQGEKPGLEHSLKSLQERLDRANRRLATSDVTIANLTKDRDAAHQQLANAYINSEGLKSEGQAVRDQIDAIKRQFAQLTREHEAQIVRLTAQEFELRTKIERRERAVHEMGALARELWETRKAFTASRGPATAGVIENGTSEFRRSPSKARTDTERPRDVAQSQLERLSNTGISRLPSQQKSQEDLTSPRKPTQRSATRRAADDQVTAPLSERNATIDIQLPSIRDKAELALDGTFLSFLDGDEIPKLRQIVDEEKALAEKAGVTMPNKHLQAGGPATKTSLNSALPRKSSLKRVQQDHNEITERSDHTAAMSKRRSDETRDGTRELPHAANSDRPAVSFSREREDTQLSTASRNSQRPRRSGSGLSSDMTSAFILPDITLTDSGTTRNATRNVVVAKQRTTITRPTPVSDRMPLALSGEDEPTMRPAQSPGLALASVLKGLEEEIAQLRVKLVEQETLYNQHDPSLSKSKRKIVYARIQKLMAAIDLRADQIYALYDVLEGQKEKGQLMTEEEVEVTLQNIGVAPVIGTWTSRRVSQQESKSGNQGKNDDIDGHSGTESEAEEHNVGEDDELPWEGFEPTITRTLESLRGLRVRA